MIDYINGHSTLIYLVKTLVVRLVMQRLLLPLNRHNSTIAVKFQRSYKNEIIWH